MGTRGLAGLVAAMATVALVGGCSADQQSTTDPSVAVTHSPTQSVATDTAPAAVQTTVAATAPPTTAEDNQAIGPFTEDELRPPPEPRACNLSSAAEAGHLIGLSGLYNAEQDRNGIFVCSLTAEDTKRLASIRIVSIQADPPPDVVFDELAASADAQPVADFGDDAVWIDGGLNIAIGDEMLTLSLFPRTTFADDDLRAATLQWAEVVVPRYEPPPAE